MKMVFILSMRSQGWREKASGSAVSTLNGVVCEFCFAFLKCDIWQKGAGCKSRGLNCYNCVNFCRVYEFRSSFIQFRVTGDRAYILYLSWGKRQCNARLDCQSITEQLHRDMFLGCGGKLEYPCLLRVLTGAIPTIRCHLQ